MDRRTALALLGGVGGAVGLGGAATLLSGAENQTAPFPKAGFPKLPWPYKPLDPVAIGNQAYEAYYRGDCMYGTFEPIVSGVVALLGDAYKGFPYEMFFYGKGGVYGWGTLCGCLNGCAAAIQMLSPKPEPLIDELYRWYQNTSLPDFEPKGMKFKLPKSVSGSPLCHTSIAKWCEVSGHKAYSPERKDRCGILAASVAAKCAMLLNDQAGGKPMTATPVDARTGSCMSCHEKGGAMENMRSKQACAPCHSDDLLKLKGHAKIKL